MRDHPASELEGEQGEFRGQWVAPRVKRLLAGEAELTTNQNTDMEGMS